jgi:hypothetical protein
VLQVLLLFAVAAVLGWRPGLGVSPVALVVVLVLGTVTFASLGLLAAAGRGDAAPAACSSPRCAGRHPRTDVAPSAAGVVADLLPAAALTEALRRARCRRLLGRW